MKKNSLIIIAFGFFIAAVIGCTKGDDYRYKTTAEFTFINAGAKYVTTDVAVNPKDSLYFQWNVKATSNIKRVIATKSLVTAILDTTIVPYANRNDFTTTKRYLADSIPGVYNYIFTAYDSLGSKLGTKNITVTVNSDINFYTALRLYVPDSTAKTNKTYFSTSTAQTFSYSEGAANSAKIDFGYFYDTTTAGAPKHTIYALNASTFLPYDVSTWTKNATVFKRITSPAFAAISSASEIRKQGIANLASGATSKITSLPTSTPAGTLTNNIILFKTAAGKYGVILVTYTSDNSASPGTYINLEVKTEK